MMLIIKKEKKGPALGLWAVSAEPDEVCPLWSVNASC